jgi:hypothetical protein
LSGRSGDSLHVVTFGDDSEAEAFLAALTRFLGYPEGNRFSPQAQAWVRRATAGARAEVLLNQAALEASTAAFGSVPVFGERWVPRL